MRFIRVFGTNNEVSGFVRFKDFQKPYIRIIIK